MSSGGSNYSTGMTGGSNQVRIDSPASQQNGYGSAPAPGGKGGFPSAQSPYQQQPSVYMPPSQPSFYQQAFTQPRMEAPPRQYGLGGMGGNAYARPYRAQPFVQPDLAPVYAGGSKNFNEMQYERNEKQDVSGPDLAPAVMPSDSWGSRRFRDPFAAPIVKLKPTDFADSPQPVQATSAVMPEPNYSGGLGSLMSGMNNSAAQAQAQAQQNVLAAARQNDQAMRQAGAQPYGYFTAPGGGQLWNA